MYFLFEIADRDVLFIVLAIFAAIIFVTIIYFIVTKDKRVRPISEDERYDLEEELEEKVLIEEQEKAKEELERVYNQMSMDLDEKNKENKIDKFESEQEENAIISYQELIKQAKIKQEKPSNEVIKEHVEKQKKQEKVSEEPKKFRSSEIISPIFGVQNKPVERKMTYQEISNDDDNVDFLNSLKEFRKNL